MGKPAQGTMPKQPVTYKFDRSKYMPPPPQSETATTVDNATMGENPANTMGDKFQDLPISFKGFFAFGSFILFFMAASIVVFTFAT